VRLRLERIERKQRAARAAIGSPRNVRLEESLQAVHAGAWTLARQIRALREARSRLDPLALKCQTDQLEQDLNRLADPSARTAAQAALVERRKALALLEDMDRAQTRSALRLAAIEATLDTTCLTLQQPPQEPRAPFEEPLLRDLEAEVSAIAEVAHEISSLNERP
jgi:hypothetical protein